MDWIRNRWAAANRDRRGQRPLVGLGPSVACLAVVGILTLPAPTPAQSSGMRPPRAQAPLPAVYAEAEPGLPFEAPPAETLAARRAALLSAIGEGLVILKSASMKSIEGDYPQDSDFRQHNDFFYLTGLETPDSWLMLSADGSGTGSEALFIPERNPDEEQWTGRKPSFEEAADISGISSVRAVPEFMRALQGQVFVRRSAPAVYAPLNRHTREDEIIQGLVFEARATVQDVDPVMAQLRLVKDQHEIRMLRRAIDITTAAQRAAMRAARPGMHEYELESVIEFNFRLGGAERVGFPSIVGSGPNSVVLHYDKSRRLMEDGDLVVIDVGAEYSYYTADVTRTIPVSGRFTERQRQIYALVLGAQQAVLDAIRPGMTVGDLTRISRTWLQENSGDACGQRTCDAYFIHGLSHWLGMDVHDVGSYETPLRAGMVLTIEPGIYLPDENLGVRIEDDILVTPTGNENLSAAAPRDPDQIEALMADEVAQS